MSDVFKCEICRGSVCKPLRTVNGFTIIQCDRCGRATWVVAKDAPVQDMKQLVIENFNLKQEVKDLKEQIVKHEKFEEYLKGLK